MKPASSVNPSISLPKSVQIDHQKFSPQEWPLSLTPILSLLFSTLIFHLSPFHILTASTCCVSLPSLIFSFSPSVSSPGGLCRKLPHKFFPGQQTDAASVLSSALQWTCTIPTHTHVPLGVLALWCCQLERVRL